MSDPWMTGIGASNFQRLRTVAVNQSPFNGASYRSGMQDDRWALQFDYPTMTRATAAPLLAAIAGQRGGTGSFGAFDPDYGVPRSRMLSRGAVNGAGQSGLVLATDGWPIDVVIAEPGDMAFVGRAGSAYFNAYTVTAQSRSSVIGQATIALDAPMMSPPDNAIVGFAPAIWPDLRVEFRLTGFSKPSQPGALFQISIQAEEII